MGKGPGQYILPQKVDSYFATLNLLYKRSREDILREIVIYGAISIHEGWDYDNWDGGQHGHAITLTLPEDLYVRVFDKKDDIRSRICQDINKINNTQNEHVSEVFVEMEPAGKANWRERTEEYRPIAVTSSVAPDALQRIWGGVGHVRVFLSHKSSVKVQTARIKKSLVRCGVAAFVAHEDIEPTEEWQHEIERALSSMDVLVALLSEDFHDSNWTDQEVGFALGRGVPLIAVRLGKDPYGLMGKAQGLGGCRWDEPEIAAAKLFQLFYKRLRDKSRLFECALFAYASSSSFADSAWKVENLLSLFEELTPDQVARVADAYRANLQNKNSFKGVDLLLPLLEKWTGKKWTIKNNELVATADAAG